MLMVGVHVAHDCRVGNGVIMANGVMLAGHVRVDDGAFLSGVVLVHQFVRIGRLAILSPLSTVMQDIPPFSMAGGRRSQVHGVNIVGLRRAGLDAETRARIQNAQRILYRSNLTTTEALALLREDPAAETRELVAFVEDSRRGIASFGQPAARGARLRRVSAAPAQGQAAALAQSRTSGSGSSPHTVGGGSGIVGEPKSAPRSATASAMFSAASSFASQASTQGSTGGGPEGKR
jgi:hypothetical protein